MKKIIQYTLAAAFVSMTIASCDKVEFPNIPTEGVDTTLYPGLFAEYSAPTFSENSNTNRNVLIEDFTGHKCGACPNAATIAANLEEDNPDRVFVASIHAGPSNNGVTSFQTVQAPDYPVDFTTPEGLEIASTFFQLGVGFAGNPRGAISRISSDAGAFMFSQGSWVDRTEAALATTLKVNLQAKSNFFPETRGLYMHVETDFEATLSGDYNIVIYAIENSITAPQLVDVVRDEDYKHHNVHIGNVFNETFGRSVATGDITAGTKVVTNFSYVVPEGLAGEDMHFLIFVYDKATYEVMQVIKHEFED